MKKYVCTICGFIYDEAEGIPEAGIAAGTKWEDLPEDWTCPLCGASKAEFEPQEEEKAPASAALAPVEESSEELRELSMGELSALCSNLARGCEKQYLSKESALFSELAEYFKKKTPQVEGADTESLCALVEKNLSQDFAAANNVAKAAGDRGAQRALVWSEKVSKILNSLLNRYNKEGEAFLENTNVYVCEVCGFIYIGDNPPELCPVCKVPSWKFAKIGRRQ